MESKRKTSKQERDNRRGFVAGEFCTPVRDGRTKLIHIQLGKYVDIWIADDEE